MKILVLGNGYVGGFLVKALREKGHDVRIASRNGVDDCFRADLGSSESVETLARTLEQEDFIPDSIVHCASSGRGGPDAYRSVFVEGAGNLISVFPDTIKIFTSSTSVYPQVDGGIVTEESPADPDRETGKYLREAEDLLLENRGIVLRLTGIYGPGRSIHLKRMLEGSAAIESGEVSRWLNQIHRDDAAGAIIHLLESNIDLHRGQIYNVADNHPISQRECYETLAKILDKPVPGESPPDKNGKRAWTHKKVSNAKLRATGWEPLYPSFTRAVIDDKRMIVPC